MLRKIAVPLVLILLLALVLVACGDTAEEEMNGDEGVVDDGVVDNGDDGVVDDGVVDNGDDGVVDDGDDGVDDDGDDGVDDDGDDGVDDEPTVDSSQVYANNCTSCHGPTGTEGPGPDIAGMNADDVEAKIGAGHNEITLSPEELEALAEYIADGLN